MADRMADDRLPEIGPTVHKIAAELTAELRGSSPAQPQA